MAKNQPKHIVAKPIHPAGEKLESNREIWAKVAYYYPQYSLKDASQLPIRDLKLLLRVARKVEAGKMFELTQIAAAPHTEKGKGVSKLLDYFRKEMR